MKPAEGTEGRDGGRERNRDRGGFPMHFGMEV